MKEVGQEIKIEPVYRSGKPLLGRWEYSSETEVVGPVYHSDKPLCGYLPKNRKREEYITKTLSKKYYSEFAKFIDTNIGEWAKKMKIPPPEWLISAGDNWFYSKDRRIVLPAGMARLYKSRSDLKDYPYLLYWVAHEFFHYVAEIQKLSFADKIGEEDYGSKLAEHFTGIAASEAYVALHKLLKKVWDNELGEITLEDALGAIPDDRRPEQKWLPALDNGNEGEELPEEEEAGEEEGYYEDVIPAFDETFGFRTRRFDNRGKPRSEWVKLQEGKLVPALKPFDPYEFAKYALKNNVFGEEEIPIYSGRSGLNPHGVSDATWQKVVADLDVRFVKYGDWYTILTNEIETPPYMRAKPIWQMPLTPANIALLAATEGDPLRKFCCRQCGECAPKELLEEGKFPERIDWLRNHYKEKHPSMWGHTFQPETTEEIKIKPVWKHVEHIEPSFDETFGIRPREWPLKTLPSRKEELEFVSDSPEFLAYTIEDIGYRDKLDKAFEMAIARAKGG